MTLQLRPYQREGIDALYAYWRDGGGNPLLVYPTGAGKSLVLAAIVQELLRDYPTMRIGVVTHVRELISQDIQELLRLWPAAPAGIYSAGLGRRDVGKRILFCGIQSAWKRARDIGPFDLLLIDEAHLISRSTDTTYGKFISALREMNPDMRVVGLTATPYRLDSGRLDDGADALFERIIYEAKLNDLIDEGYLSALISKGMASEIDVSSVSKRGGEFVAGDLERAANGDAIVESAVRELVSFGHDRRAWLVFCSGVKHAGHVRDEIMRHGVSCEAITGDMASGERDSIISRFRSGQIRCLTSVGVLTTGFNVPHVDLIGMMRPTLSTGLYVQQIGRGFRVAPGKANCLVLDWAGNVRRHGPVDLIEIKPRRGKKPGAVAVDDVRAKECPTCKTMAALNARMCAICGHEWSLDSVRHDAEADDVAILSRDLKNRPPEEIAVVTWTARRHQKSGSPDSLRVTYSAGLMTYPEWVTFEHAGPGRYRAERWWARHGGAEPCPACVGDALERWAELSPPSFIAVRRNGKWFDIVSRRFGNQEQGEAA